MHTRVGKRRRAETGSRRTDRVTIQRTGRWRAQFIERGRVFHRRWRALYLSTIINLILFTLSVFSLYKLDVSTSICMGGVSTCICMAGVSTGICMAGVSACIFMAGVSDAHNDTCTQLIERGRVSFHRWRPLCIPTDNDLILSTLSVFFICRLCFIHLYYTYKLYSSSTA